MQKLSKHGKCSMAQFHGNLQINILFLLRLSTVETSNQHMFSKQKFYNPLMYDLCLVIHKLCLGIMRPCQIDVVAIIPKTINSLPNVQKTKYRKVINSIQIKWCFPERIHCSLVTTAILNETFNNFKLEIRADITGQRMGMGTLFVDNHR